MDLTEARIISILSLGLGTILIGLCPSCFTHHGRQKYPLLLSSLLCFGAGVLLSTSLVHILPEVRKNAAPNYQQYVELIFCGGFFLLYLTDEIMHCFYDPHVSAHNHSSPIDRRHSSYGATERDPLLFRQQSAYNPSFSRRRSDSELLTDGNPPSQLCHVSHKEPCNYGPIVNIGLLVALSVHALLEGLVVGLESVPSKVLLLLGAIASHKLVVGFCLGVELSSNPQNSSLKNFISILIFALGSVTGIIIGIFISKLPEQTKNVTIPILQALAGGTLMYVTVSEVLPRERARWHEQHRRKRAGPVQFITVGLGFAMMSILTLYLDFDDK